MNLAHATTATPAADALAATIPGAQLTVIPDATHNPHQENTDAWLAAVAAHFTRL